MLQACYFSCLLVCGLSNLSREWNLSAQFIQHFISVICCLQASEDAKKLVNEERAFARFEIENARAAVQRVEEALQEHERMSEASGKQVWIISSSIMLSVFFSQFKYICLKYNEFLIFEIISPLLRQVLSWYFQIPTSTWALMLSCPLSSNYLLGCSSFRAFFVSFGLVDISPAKFWVLVSLMDIPCCRHFHAYIIISSLPNYRTVFMILNLIFLGIFTFKENWMLSE